MDRGIRDRVYRQVDEEAERLIADLCRLLAQPSICAQKLGIAECVELLVAMMQEAGIRTEVLPTGGAPVVFGEVRAPGPAPTLAIYGHYDVQPPDPLDQWKTPPFQPTRIGDLLFARGATDDKGNLMANLKAVDLLRRVRTDFPLNLVFLFEGEEETGSPHLADFLRRHAARFRGAHAMINCDRGVHESGRPALFLGNKGMVKAEIELHGPNRDVHSNQAPILPNPVWDLVGLLHAVKPDGRTVAIPGFYDRAVGPTPLERQLIADIPFSAEDYRREYGVDRLLADGSPADILTTLLFSPTFNIQGIVGGYTGLGSKTIVPARVTAKLDIRLVKDMTVDDTVAKLRAFFAARGLESALQVKSGVEPCKAPAEDPVVQAAVEAARQAYGTDPVVWPLLEGTGPFALVPEILGIPMFTIGLGAPFSTANQHAPNENIGITQYLTGIKMMATLFLLYGERGRVD